MEELGASEAHKTEILNYEVLKIAFFWGHEFKKFCLCPTFQKINRNPLDQLDQVTFMQNSP